MTSDVHGDMIGSMRMMTDEVSGAIVAEAVYTAFGELRPGSSNERYGYAGAWGYQTDTPGDMPFMHVGHRYYDPSTGRFLQRDPIGIFGGMNTYAYVKNRPSGLVDPDGLEPCPTCGHDPDDDDDGVGLSIGPVSVPLKTARRWVDSGASCFRDWYYRGWWDRNVRTPITDFVNWVTRPRPPKPGPTPNPNWGDYPAPPAGSGLA